jgi:hypothetical protein
VGGLWQPTGGLENTRDLQAVFLGVGPQAGAPPGPFAGPLLPRTNNPSTSAVHPRQVVNIVDRQFNYVCSGPFARTCNKLKSMTGASASVVDVAEFALRDGSPCTKCISQVGSPGAACYPKGNTWTS